MEKRRLNSKIHAAESGYGTNILFNVFRRFFPKEARGTLIRKTSEQVALRWLIEQENVFAIPRSANPNHIASNFEIFDFSLDEFDRRRIDELPKVQRQIDPDFAPDWEEEKEA